MTNIDSRARFTFRLPKKLLGDLKSNADRNGISVNALMLEILRNWVEKNDKETRNKL